jgi:uncharacterized protein YcbK (DUF882 family)
MGQLTKNFRSEEFACRCGCGYDDINLELVRNLQKLRDLLGKPVRIISGCRCESHNAAVGGAPNSFHMKGKAADITTKTISPGALADYAEDHIPAFENGGVGRYRGFVHLDIGPKRRW